MPDDHFLPTRQHTLERWAQGLARGTPAPGGGAAAAVTLALAAALVEMVARMTLDRPRYAPVHTEMKQAAQAAEELRERLLYLAGEDAQAVATKRGTVETQVELAARARAVAQLARRVAESGHAPARGDAIMAAVLAAAVARGAAINVAINRGDQAESAGRDAEAAEQEAGIVRTIIPP